MKNVKFVLFAIMILVLATLACGSLPTPGGGGGEAAPTKEASQPGGGGGSGSGGGGSAEKDLSLTSLTEGRTSLKSYRAKMTMQFDGKDEDGNPVNGTMEMIEEFVQEPKAQRIAATITGLDTQGTGSGTFEIITIGDTSYMVMQDQGGEKQCFSMSSSDTEANENGLFSPDAMGGVSDAKYVGTENVNGISTKHYQWKEGGLAGLGFTSGHGDVWVAVDGNYVVKYSAEATGKGALFGSAQDEGTIKVEYNLTEVNQPFTIEPPAGCESAASDIPVLQDAEEKSMFGGVVTYKTKTAFADVVQFYKDEMPNNGWQPSGDPTEMEGLAMFDYTKENQKAQVMISEDKDNNVINVMVSVSEE